MKNDQGSQSDLAEALRRQPGDESGWNQRGLARAEQDPQGALAAFEEALKANKKVYTLYVYEGTQHGFHNDTTPRYDEKAAKLAWTRTLELFNKYLRREA